jgi:hypothetical protein
MNAPRPLPVASISMSAAALGVCLSLFGPLGAQTEVQATAVGQEPPRQPRFAYTETGGCGDIYVFTANADRSEVIWVHAALKGSSGPSANVSPLPPPPSVPLKLPWVQTSVVPPVGVREYDVTTPKDGLRAGLDFNGPGEDFYCSDVGGLGGRVTWPAVAGHLTLTIRHPETPTTPCEMDQCFFMGYPLELKIDQMTFQRPDGRRVELPAPLTLKTAGGIQVGG